MSAENNIGQLITAQGNTVKDIRSAMSGVGTDDAAAVTAKLLAAGFTASDIVGALIENRRRVIRTQVPGRFYLNTSNSWTYAHLSWTWSYHAIAQYAGAGAVPTYSWATVGQEFLPVGARITKMSLFTRVESTNNVETLDVRLDLLSRPDLETGFYSDANYGSAPRIITNVVQDTHQPIAGQSFLHHIKLREYDIDHVVTEPSVMVLAARATPGSTIAATRYWTGMRIIEWEY